MQAWLSHVEAISLHLFYYTYIHQICIALVLFLPFGPIFSLAHNYLTEAQPIWIYSSLMAPSKTSSKKRKTTSRIARISQQQSGPLPAEKTKKKFPCLRTHRCKGRLKQLSRTTYLKHALFCEIDAQREAEAEGSTAPPHFQEDPEFVLPGDNETTEVLAYFLLYFIFTDLPKFEGYSPAPSDQRHCSG